MAGRSVSGRRPRRKLFVHPAIRVYREELFRRLGADGMEFLWTTINSGTPHAQHEVESILRAFPYANHQAREWKFLPFSNFSPDLSRILSYDVVVFSGLTSVPFVAFAPLLHALRRKVLLFDELWGYPHGVPIYRAAFPVFRTIVQRCVSAVITAGSRSKAFYRDELGVPDDKIFMSYNSTVDLSRRTLSESRAEEVRMEVEAVSRGRKVILFLGRIVNIKGLDVLIRALAFVPPSACLVVVGEGPLKEEYRQLAAGMGLGDRVHFVAGCHNEDAAYYYRQADVFVLPSRFMNRSRVRCDSWGFTLNEAMSLGVPCVSTTAVGAAYDLIVDGVTGARVEAGDAVALGQRLAQWIMDDRLRKDIGQNGRVRLSEVCDIQVAYKAFTSAMRLG
jgi:glycosyltransferase involved in cell wall biosynthesis